MMSISYMGFRNSTRSSHFDPDGAAREKCLDL